MSASVRGSAISDGSEGQDLSRQGALQDEGGEPAVDFKFAESDPDDAEFCASRISVLKWVMWPVWPTDDVVRDKVQNVEDAEWGGRFALHYEEARGMEEQKEWSSALPLYRKCKDMFLEAPVKPRGPRLEGVYKWLALLVGRRLVSLLQARHAQLGDSERSLLECVFTLEWLITDVIWQYGSMVLLMHREAVRYQLSREVNPSDAAALDRAEELSARFSLYTKFFFCLSLAATLPHEAGKWLLFAREHIDEQPLDASSDCLLKHALMTFQEEIGAWKECVQVASELKNILEDDRRKADLGLGSEFDPESYAIEWEDVTGLLGKYATREGEQRAVRWRSDFKPGRLNDSVLVLDIDVATDSIQQNTVRAVCVLPENWSSQRQFVIRKYGSLKARFKLEESPLADAEKVISIAKKIIEDIISATWKYESLKARVKQKESPLADAEKVTSLKEMTSIAKKILKVLGNGSANRSTTRKWRQRLVDDYTDVVRIALGRWKERADFRWIDDDFRPSEFHRLLNESDIASSNLTDAIVEMRDSVMESGTDDIEFYNYAYSRVAVAYIGFIHVDVMDVFCTLRDARVYDIAYTVPRDAQYRLKLKTRLDIRIQAFLQASEDVAKHWSDWMSSQPAGLSDYEFLHFLDTREYSIVSANTMVVDTFAVVAILLSLAADVVSTLKIGDLLVPAPPDPCLPFATKSAYLESSLLSSRVQLLSYIERSLCAFFVFRTTRQSLAGSTNFPWTWKELQSPNNIVWNIICDCQKFCSAPTFVRSSPMSIPSSKVLFLPFLPRQNSVLVVYDFRANQGNWHIYVIHQESQLEGDLGDLGRCNIVDVEVPHVDMGDLDKELKKLYDLESELYRVGNQSLVDKTLRYMYNILVQPISHVLDKLHMRVEDKLIFVGGKYFIRVPFAILKDPTTDKYLFQQHTVSVTSSFSALWHCHQRFKDLQASSIEEAALAVADPAYKKKKDRLPGSLSEVKCIQDIFEDSDKKIRVDKLEGTKANIDSFLEAVERPGRRPFLHLAQHAGVEKRHIYDRSGGLLAVELEQPVLLFADPTVVTWPPQNTNQPTTTTGNSRDSDEAEEIEDLSADGQGWRSSKSRPGTLSADDLLRRGKAWNVDMVALSSCQSAWGQMLYSGGLLNLPQALMLAGVPCVIASLWKILDGPSTQQLMNHFYQALKQGLDAASSLRQAMENMLQAPEPHNVLEWGAFSVWGLPTVGIDAATPSDRPCTGEFEQAHWLDAASGGMCWAGCMRALSMEAPVACTWVNGKGMGSRFGDVAYFPRLLMYFSVEGHVTLGSVPAGTYTLSLRVSFAGGGWESRLFSLGLRTLDGQPQSSQGYLRERGSGGGTSTSSAQVLKLRPDENDWYECEIGQFKCTSPDLGVSFHFSLLGLDPDIASDPYRPEEVKLYIDGVVLRHVPKFASAPNEQLPTPTN